MTKSTRIKGNVVPVFKLTGLSNATPSASAIDPSDDLISVSLTDGDGAEALTFSDFAEGKAPLAFELEFAYSGDTASLYQQLWLNAGRSNVAFVYGRHGNDTAAAGKPVDTGTLTIPAKFGWEAGASESDEDTVSVTLQIDTIDRAHA